MFRLQNDAANALLLQSIDYWIARPNRVYSIHDQ